MAKRRSSRQTFIQRSRATSAEKKALIHQVHGAGRAGVVRPFLGLTPDDERQIQAQLEAWIDRTVIRGV